MSKHFAKLWLSILTGLMLLSLTACGTPSGIQQAARERLNPAWTQDCPVADPDGRDNKALARWAQALKGSLLQCNLDKASIREWDNAPR